MHPFLLYNNFRRRDIFESIARSREIIKGILDFSSCARLERRARDYGARYFLAETREAPINAWRFHPPFFLSHLSLPLFLSYGFATFPERVQPRLPRFPRFPARHIVLPVVEAWRRVPLHNVLDVLERVGASGPDDIFPSRLLSEINCHSIFIVVYLSRQLPPRPLSLDNRLINQAFFFVVAVMVFLPFFVRRKDFPVKRNTVSLIDYCRESIDLAPNLMSITETTSLVELGRSRKYFRRALLERIQFYI